VRPRKTFEGENEIIIAGVRSGDVVSLICSTAGVVLIACGVVATASGAARDGSLLWTLAILPFLVWVMMGPVWRLTNRQPLLQANAAGLKLHPSLLKAFVTWSQVKSIAIKSDGAGRVGPSQSYIRLRLRQPVRTLWRPLGSSEVRLRLFHLNLSYREGEDLLRQLRRVRRATTPGDR
jgi:hypothetical protein